MDIALIIEKILPNAEYSGSVTSNNREIWDKVIWTDSRIKKPAYEELELEFIKVNKEQLSKDIRSTRDKLISDTDYKLMPDYPIPIEELENLKLYRQKLRDITEQEGFPFNVVWPTLEKPSFLQTKFE